MAKKRYEKPQDVINETAEIIRDTMVRIGARIAYADSLARSKPELQNDAQFQRLLRMMRSAYDKFGGMLETPAQKENDNER